MTKEEKILQLKQKDKARIRTIKKGILATKLYNRGVKVPDEIFDRAAKELNALKKEREKTKKNRSK